MTHIVLPGVCHIAHKVEGESTAREYRHRQEIQHDALQLTCTSGRTYVVAPSLS